jgi:hypothetical protein
VTRRFAVTFDYLCPFARNAAEHVLDGLEAGADWDVTFTPYSLSQGHVEEGDTDIWDRDQPFDASGILALSVGLVVRDRFFYSWEQGLRAAGLQVSRQSFGNRGRHFPARGEPDVERIRDRLEHLLCLGAAPLLQRDLRREKLSDGTPLTELAVKVWKLLRDLYEDELPLELRRERRHADDDTGEGSYPDAESTIASAEALLRSRHRKGAG